MFLAGGENTNSQITKRKNILYYFSRNCLNKKQYSESLFVYFMILDAASPFIWFEKIVKLSLRLNY